MFHNSYTERLFHSIHNLISFQQAMEENKGVESTEMDLGMDTEESKGVKAPQREEEEIEMIKEKAGVKLTTKNLMHYNFQLKRGWNTDICTFTPRVECGPGGLYFTELEHAHEWTTVQRPQRLTTMWDVHLAKGDPVARFKFKSKAPRIHLSNPRPIPEEVWLCALDQDRCDLDDVPQESRTLRVCETALERDLRALKYIPSSLQTPTFYSTCVENNWEALQYVPDAFQTHEMCLTAVRQCGEAIQHVCSIHFHEHYKDLCFVAVNNCGLALRYVDDEFKSLELCGVAVEECGKALKYVPGNHKTRSMCLKAVQESPLAMLYVPDYYQTPELCLVAIKKNPNSLRMIDWDRLTFEMCLAAVQQDAALIVFVPERFMTSELCMEAIENWGPAIAHIASRFNVTVTYEMYLAAVRKDPELFFSQVPEQFRTRQMSLIVSKKLPHLKPYLSLYENKIQAPSFNT